LSFSNSELSVLLRCHFSLDIPYSTNQKSSKRLPNVGCTTSPKSVEYRFWVNLPKTGNQRILGWSYNRHSVAFSKIFILCCTGYYLDCFWWMKGELDLWWSFFLSTSGMRKSHLLGNLCEKQWKKTMNSAREVVGIRRWKTLFVLKIHFLDELVLMHEISSLLAQ
jgi:hypothetical protein